MNLYFWKSDIRGGQRVKLCYNKNIFLVTDSGSLINVKNGALGRKIDEVFDDVEKVFSSENKLIAIKAYGKLQVYDATFHDKDIQEIKRKNKFKDYSEFEYWASLKSRGDFNVNVLKFEEIKRGKYFNEIGLEKTCKCWQAIEPFVFRFTTQKSDARVCNLIVTKYEIDKKRNVYFYRYETTSILI